MAENNGKVRFIRVRGRIVPIRQKERQGDPRAPIPVKVAAGAAIGGGAGAVTAESIWRSKNRGITKKIGDLNISDRKRAREYASKLQAANSEFRSAAKNLGSKQAKAMSLLTATENELSNVGRNSSLLMETMETYRPNLKKIVGRILRIGAEGGDIGERRALKAFEILDERKPGAGGEGFYRGAYRDLLGQKKRINVLEKRRNKLWDLKFSERDKERKLKYLTEIHQKKIKGIKAAKANNLLNYKKSRGALTSELSRARKNFRGVGGLKIAGAGALLGAGASLLFGRRRDESGR